MLFPTAEYAIFFLIVAAIAWLLAARLFSHKLFLLVASYVFYGSWSWRYVPLLFCISAVAGVLARLIQLSPEARERKFWLVLGVVICLTTLVYYKYTSFLLLQMLGLWGLVGRTPVWDLPAPLLPLGVSFFTFHAISLLGDAYRGKLREPVRLLDALLYVSFFPQLIAGPILRASSFLPQLQRRRDPNHIRMNRAFLLIASGLFKKVIISNILATRLVEPVFAAPSTFGRWDVLFAVYGYAAEIYCDFSGYTDIAIGCALLLGYRFPRNFNAPYTASNPQEFWDRWHISLSTWLRDYLYIPLGGSRRGNVRTYVNLMITMLLGGLWHGASWTFVIWGGLQGSYLVVHRLWSRTSTAEGLRGSTAWTWFSRLLLFHAVCLGWIFFRSSTFMDGITLLRRFAAPGRETLLTYPIVLALVLGLFGQYMPRMWRRTTEAVMSRLPAAVNGLLLAMAVYLIEILGPTGVAPFIYFQF